MSKEYKLISATVALSLALHACSPFEKPKSVKAAPLIPTPTLPQPTQESVIDTPMPYEIPIIATPESSFAEKCILPFEGASMEGGLQFLSPIMTKNGKQDRDELGRPYRHLGLDFKGNNPLGGDQVFNMCNGTYVFSGYVGNEYTSHRNMKTLGNVVVIKYDYSENGAAKSLYMVYAHLKNPITDLDIGETVPLGANIGEVSNSGGWLFPHLHLNAWTQEAWTYLLNERFHGDISSMAGFYPDSEFDDGEVLRDMVDPKTWLQERLEN